MQCLFQQRKLGFNNRLPRGSVALKRMQLQQTRQRLKGLHAVHSQQQGSGCQRASHSGSAGQGGCRAGGGGGRGGGTAKQGAQGLRQQHLVDDEGSCKGAEGKKDALVIGVYTCSAACVLLELRSEVAGSSSARPGMDSNLSAPRICGGDLHKQPSERTLQPLDSQASPAVAASRTSASAPVLSLMYALPPFTTTCTLGHVSEPHRLVSATWH